MTECGDNCECGCKRRKFLCCALGCTAALLLIVVVILAVAGWFLLHPSKPQFSLQNMAIHELNMEPTYPEGIVTSFLEPTIVVSNANRGVGVHYDLIRAFVEYKNRQLTTPAYAPPMYLDGRAVDVWTPYLAGNQVPLKLQHFSPLWEDWASRHVVLNVKLEATIRWRVGPWMSNHHDLNVTCPAILTFPDHVHPQLQQASACSVDV